MDLQKITNALRSASSELSLQNALQKNTALLSVIKSIESNRSVILSANAEDVQKARSKGMSESLVERLALDDK